MGLAQLGESIKDEFFFPKHCAWSNPDRVPRGKKLLDSGIERSANANGIIFEISKDGHLLWICSDGLDPLPVCLGLHTHDCVISEHAAQPTAHKPVSRERFVGDSAIDHDHADSADSAFAKKIRPDFGLGDDDDLGTEPI